MARANNSGWYRNLYRLVRSKLVIPVVRSRHSPEHTARGVMVGMVCAMTPTVGIQMSIVLFAWFVAHRWLRWDFSLVNGIAWSWVTNVFTMVPIYYVFYVTGQFIMGRFGDLGGYESFKRVWSVLLTSDGDWWQRLVAWVDVMITDWGLPMLVGCVPWAILFGWLGYRLSLNYVIRHREIRRQKQRQRQRIKHQRAGEATTG